MKKLLGFSIIELVIFIVIVGLMAAGSLVAFNTVLTQNSTPAQNLQAALLADARMNMITLYRLVNGFGSIADPCATTASPACSAGPTACRALCSHEVNIKQTITMPITPVAGTITSGTGTTATSTVTVTVTGTGRATNEVVFVQ